jgi:hypothetical protein
MCVGSTNKYVHNSTETITPRLKTINRYKTNLLQQHNQLNTKEQATLVKKSQNYQRLKHKRRRNISITPTKLHKSLHS